MAEIKSPEHPLDVLPAMLNLVLIQTGKLLRDPDSHNVRAIGLTRSKINEYVPLANDRFHDALDEIEIKILDAKAVMERDLSVIRKRRAERLGVKTASKIPTPGESENLSGLDGATISALQNPQVADIDLNMLDVPGEDANNPMDIEMSGDLAIANQEGLSQDDTNAAGLAISMPTEAIEKGQTKADESKDADPANNNVADAPESSNQAADTDQFDFDTMFNDADFNADASMNFDMDLGTEGLLNGDAFENIAMTAGNITDGAPTGGEDISSLLPGLDDVVNASNLPTAPNGAAQVASSSAGAGGTSGPAAASNQNDRKTNPSDSQFDDIFGSDFNLDDNTNVGDLGDFNFDDEWTKMTSG